MRVELRLTSCDAHCPTAACVPFLVVVVVVVVVVVRVLPAAQRSWDLGVVMPLLVYLTIMMPFRLAFDNEAPTNSYM